MIVFGGGDGAPRNDVWALSLGGDPVWKQLNVEGTAPTPRGRAAMIYDPMRDRLLIYGGSPHPRTAGAEVLGDVWELSLAGRATWRQVVPEGEEPMARRGPSAIYDPVRDRMVVFGGLTAGDQWSDETWALSLGGAPRWTRIEASGLGPSARWLHAAIYDPVGDRMVVFGGNSSEAFGNHDTYALSLAGDPAWVRIEPIGELPPRLLWPEAIYDPVRDRMVVYGGEALTPLPSRPSSETWVLRLSGTPSWSRIAVSPQPPPRWGHTGVYDAAGDRLVIFGGTAALSDAWALALESPRWTRLAPRFGVPLDRVGQAAIYDPVRDRMLVFGTTLLVSDYDYFGSPWQLSLSSRPEWRPLEFPNPPALIGNHPAFYDSAEDRVVVLRGPSGDLAVVPQLTLSGEPAWGSLSASGAVPPDGWMTAAFDSRRRRIIAFGLGAPPGVRAGSQTWALELEGGPRWVPIEAMPPLPVESAASIYDPIRDRVVMFGGLARSGLPPGYRTTNEVWVLSLSEGSPSCDPRCVAWEQLSPLGTPPARRFGASAIYDPRRDRMIVFGGVDVVGPRYDTEVWSLSLEGPGQWTRLEPSGFLPVPRWDSSVVYDARRDRMVVFGGTGAGDMEDAWFLYWTPPVTQVAIDIRPGSADNPLSLNGDGVLPVAILGSPEVEVSTVDLESVRLAGGGVQRNGAGQPAAVYSDLNGDGITDLSLKVVVAEMEVGAQDTIAVLTGVTFDGEAFEGQDRIRIVGERGRGAERSQSVAAPAAGPELAILGVGPGTASATVQVRFSLPGAEAASLELFDLAGRRRARAQVGELGRGAHALDLTGQSLLTSGVYWVRLTQGLQVRTMRTVLVR